MSNNQDYTKGLVVGALIGGVAAAITALLLAPKSGAELRKDIASTTTDMYGKASDYYKKVEQNVGETVSHTYQEGKQKAQNIIESARRQAEDLLSSAENVLKDARTKASSAKEQVQEKIDTLREAAKASADAFKSELRTHGEDDVAEM